MLLIIVGVLILVLYLYGTRNFKYWEIRGIKYDRPVPFLGTVTQVFLQNISISEYVMKLYKKYPDEKLVGFFIGSKPIVIVKDPELVKHVMSTDFQNFYAKGINTCKEVNEPIMKNLFSIDGDTWKLLRQRLTPAFTSGKLKAMFPLIMERAEILQKIAANAAETGKEVDVRELIARYTTDFIGAVGFGIDSDSLNEEDSVFRNIGKRIFTINKRYALIRMLKRVAPNIFRHWHLYPPEIESHTVTLMKRVMRERDYKPSGRHDFIDLLLELKQKGKIVGESLEKKNPDGTPQTVELVMDDLIMAAQVFIFFAAGFETSSSSSSFTLHQLAYHPEEQRKCQEEIDEVLSRHGGKMSYDAIKEMKYLEMCFRESMRIFPSLGFISRESASKYTLPGTDVTIDGGVLVIIPVHGLHTDEKYFDNPEQFRPERFHPDNVRNMEKFAYLPFGAGPRACIGERLGLMQSIAGLAAILSKFYVEPSRSTLRDPVIDPTSTVVQNIVGGLPLTMNARNKK